MANRKQPNALSDQLRAIIEEHEMSRYRISKETGIDASQLLRFMRGTGQISSNNLDKLAECLNLEIRVREEK